MSAPLVVNTVDGTVWLRRAATRGGLALYAPQDVCRCPEFVMATEAELAEHGISGSADVLPMPVGPVVRSELDQARDDVVGACLARWEEEQENARLRLALASAKRGRSQLRARVADLEAERHSTNEALDDAVQALRADRDRIAELERRIAAEECRCPEPAPLCEGCRCKCHAGQAQASADKLTALFAPTQVLREEPVAEAVPFRVQAMRALLDGQRAAVEDPHDGPLHHSYRVPRDLPETGGR